METGEETEGGNQDKVKNEDQGNLDDIIAAQSVEVLQDIIDIQSSITGENEKEEETSVIIQIETQEDGEVEEEEDVKISSNETKNADFVSYSGIIHKCQFCDFASTVRDELDKHIDEGHDSFIDNALDVIQLVKPVTENGKTRFLCRLCENTFASTINVKRHIENVHCKDADVVVFPNSLDDCKSAIGKYQCEVCQKGFLSKSSLLHHSRVHGTNVHRCPYCQHSTVLKRSISRHVKNRHPEKWESFRGVQQELPCQLCKASFDKSSDLKSHLESHIGSDVYHCTFCEVNSVDLDSLILHIESKHPEEQKSANTESILATKLSAEDLELYTYIDPSSSKENDSHGSNIFSCEECNIQFSLHRNYLRHMTQHLNKFKCYQCPHCGQKNFTQFSNLTRHVRAKHPEQSTRIIKSEVEYQSDCTMSLLSQDKSYTKLFQCPYCEVNVTTNSSLNRHVSIHHGPMVSLQRKTTSLSSTYDKDEKNNVCPECKMVCDKKSDLYRHYMKHTEILKFLCPHCKYVCSQLKQMENHISLNHKDLTQTWVKTPRTEGKAVKKSELLNQKRLERSKAEANDEALEEESLNNVRKDETKIKVEVSDDEGKKETFITPKRSFRLRNTSKTTPDSGSDVEKDVTPSTSAELETPQTKATKSAKKSSAGQENSNKSGKKVNNSKKTESENKTMEQDKKESLSMKTENMEVTSRQKKSEDQVEEVKETRSATKRTDKQSQKNKTESGFSSPSVTRTGRVVKPTYKAAEYILRSAAESSSPRKRILDPDTETPTSKKPREEIKVAASSPTKTPTTSPTKTPTRTVVIKVTRKPKEPVDSNEDALTKSYFGSLQLQKSSTETLESKEKVKQTEEKTGQNESQMDLELDEVSQNQDRSSLVEQKQEGDTVSHIYTETSETSKLTDDNQQSHEEADGHLCKTCGLAFQSASGLRKHVTSKHMGREKSITCGDCGKGFLTRYECDRHQETHQRSKRNKCELCQKGFSSKKLLEDHCSISHDFESSTNDPDADNKEEGISPKKESVSDGSHYEMEMEELAADDIEVDEDLEADVLDDEAGDSQSVVKLKCSYCPMTYTKQDHLEKHEQCHVSGAKEWKCSKCEVVCFSASVLRRHLVIGHGQKQKPFCCIQCGKKFNFRYELVKHKAVHMKGTDMYKCAICSKGFPLMRQLERHAKSHWKGNTSEPADANEERDQQEVVVERPRGTGGAWQCPQCDVTFLSLSGLRKHLVVKHGAGKLYSCEDCGKSFQYEYECVRHRKSHWTTKANKCGLCQKGFRRYELLKSHMQMVHQLDCDPDSITVDSVVMTEEGGSGDVSIGDIAANVNGIQDQMKCSKCDEVFDKPEELQTHLKTQHLIPADQQKFQCPQCIACYLSESGLRKHIATAHSDKKLFECEHCGKRFHFMSDFKVHSASHLQDKPFVCEICNRGFGMEKLLRCHARRVHQIELKTEAARKKEEKLLGIAEPATYQCGECKTSYSCYSALWKHNQMKHDKRGTSFTCDTCGKQYRFRGELENHKLIHLPEPAFPCHVCGKRFTWKKTLTRHMELHQEGGPPRHSCICDICGVLFSSKSVLKRHIRRKHQPGNHRYVCKVCKQGFARRPALRKHYHNAHQKVVKPEMDENGTEEESQSAENDMDRTDDNMKRNEVSPRKYLPKLSAESLNSIMSEIRQHDEEGCPGKPWKCLLCGEYFRLVKYCNLHIRRFHVRNEDKPFKCKICGTGFPRINEFKIHSRVHTNFRPFQCKICKKTFKQGTHLKEHMNSHSAERKEHCELCGRNFSCRGALMAHISHHCPIKPFKCPNCDKAFVQRGQLSKHLLIYSNNEEFENKKSYMCHICEKVFSHFPLLMTHIETHNTDNPFQCTVCDTWFPRYTTLYLHKKNYQHFTDEDYRYAAMSSDPKKKAKEQTEQTENVKAVDAPLAESVETISASDKLNRLIHLESDVPTAEGETVVTEVWEVVEGGGAATAVSTGDEQQEMDQENLERAREEEELLSIAQQLTQMSGSLHVTNQHEDVTEVTISDTNEENFYKLLDAEDHVIESLVERHNRRAQEEVVVEEIVTSQHPQSESPVTTVQYEVNMDGSLVVTDDKDQYITLDEEHSASSTILKPSYHYVAKDGSVVYVCMTTEDDESKEIKTTEEVYTTEVNGEKYFVVTEGDSEETEMQTVTIEMEPKVEVQPALEVMTTTNEVENLMQSIISTATSCDSNLITDQSQPQPIVEEVVEGEEYVAVADHFFQDEANAHLQGKEESRQIGRTAWQVKQEDQYETEDDGEDRKERKIVPVFRVSDFDGDSMIEFQCNVCERVFNNRKAWKRHMSRHIPEAQRPYLCNVCHRRFVKPSELSRHQNIHTNTRPYKCEECGMAFRQNGHLISHKLIHEGVRPYKCIHCNAGFRTSTQMKTHVVRLHTSVRPYNCKHCDMSFKDPAALKRHSAIHSSVYRMAIKKQSKRGQNEAKTEFPPPDKPHHQCDICGKTVLGSASHLRIHRLRHKTERPFACDICNKGFKCSSDRNEHKKQHFESLETFICEVCGKDLKGRRELASHTRRHKRKEEKFDCPKCHKVYTSQQSFAYHVSSSCSEIPV